MGVLEADKLQEIIESAKGWPMWSSDRVGGMRTGTYPQAGMFGKSLRDIALWVAMRESDREALVDLLDWPSDRKMHVDPLPERIATAYSDLLFGEDPTFTAAADSDQDNLDEMIAANDLPSELKRWADLAVSEGEVWWRVWVDRDISEWPMVGAYSRLNVVPYFIGRKIAAVAFVDDILTEEIRLESSIVVNIYRHVEIQTEGMARNLLYKGGIGGLGEHLDLSERPETADLPIEWEHGLPLMLAGRVVNKLGRDFTLGISEYQGVRDLLEDLYEARTIMAENARLVLKARMVVPASAVDNDGNFDASKDVIVAESLDEEMGKNTNGPYAVLEYKFQAGELTKHKDELVLDTLSRVGLAEQFVQTSKGGSGQAFTGTALRTRLIPTTLAASGKARHWDIKVPEMLVAMQQVSALPSEKDGTGQTWADAKTAPNMKRSDVLPEDQNEETQRHVMAVQGEIESVETAVRDMHPDWDDKDIAEEVQRIKDDRALGAPPNVTGETPNIPNAPEGGPGSVVSTPQSVVGSRQPGADRGVDGQSPGKQPPLVKAGGPK